MKYIVILLLMSSVVMALPAPVGYVNDFAKVLPDALLIEQQLRDYERNTTIEIVVVTLDSLPGDQTLFSYGVELFDQWNIGKKGEDNGILVLLVKNGTTGNRMRIELGYDIQGYITGAEAGRILDEAMPYYSAGDYQSTVATILTGLSRELDNYVPGKQTGSPIDIEPLFLILLTSPFYIFFILVASVIFSMRNRCPYCMRGKLVPRGDGYICQRCGRKVTKRRRYAPILIGGGYHGGGFGGGGGGFGGGFGGGGSGGGGAGR